MLLPEWDAEFMSSDSFIKLEVPVFVAVCINPGKHQTVSLIMEVQTVIDRERKICRL
jgi:hypothetical protein